MKRPLKTTAIVPMESIEQVILTIRGQRVILAADLARLYDVPIKRLNEQIKRNPDRFPEDFMFQLTWDEARLLRSQFATLNAEPRIDDGSRSQNATLKRGQNVKYRPYAFTEHGAIMAANVLNSPQAVKASVYVVRAFVKLRHILATHRELAVKLAELERKLQKHDGQIIALIDALRQLMVEPEPEPKPPIGYATEERHAKPRARLSRRAPGIQVRRYGRGRRPQG